MDKRRLIYCRFGSYYLFPHGKLDKPTALPQRYAFTRVRE